MNVSYLWQHRKKLRYRNQVTYLKSGRRDWYSIGEVVSGKLLRIASLCVNVSEPW